MDLSRKIISLLMGVILVGAVALVRSERKCKALRAEADRQEQNVGALTCAVQYSRLGDTLPVATHEALQAKCDELQKLHLADTKLIKALKVRIKDADAIHTVAATTADTVRIAPMGSEADSIFAYADKWLSLRIDIPQRQCQYTAYDSITTVVSRIYKHKFLWWRWGTKGYQVQVVSHNPHSHIGYSRFVRVEK